MYIGLHKDSTHLPKKTVFVAEMRRRLWNTILEVASQSGLISGTPPLVSPDGFDTASPENFDESDLLAEDELPKPV